MKVGLPGIALVAVGIVDALTLQTNSTSSELLQWLTAGAFIVIGGWAVKDHIDLRKEKIEEIKAKLEADKSLAAELSAWRIEQRAMHDENRNNFALLKEQVEGSARFPGLHAIERRNSERRHLLMNQFTILSMFLTELVHTFAEVTRKTGVAFDENDAVEHLHRIIEAMHEGD